MASIIVIIKISQTLVLIIIVIIIKISLTMVLTSSLELATDPWGVHVDRVEIKDVRLPKQMQVLVIS